MPMITITIGRERVEDGTTGHTVSIGGASILAHDEWGAHAIATALFDAIRDHSEEAVQIVEGIDGRLVVLRSTRAAIRVERVGG